MSLFLELMGNNAKVATVSIRRLGLPRAGFGVVFAYEIVENGHTVRGTIERDTEDAEAENLVLVGAVLADYESKAKEASTPRAR